MRLPLRCWSKTKLMLKTTIFLVFFISFIRISGDNRKLIPKKLCPEQSGNGESNSEVGGGDHIDEITRLRVEKNVVILPNQVDKRGVKNAYTQRLSSTTQGPNSMKKQTKSTKTDALISQFDFERESLPPKIEYFDNDWKPQTIFEEVYIYSAFLDTRIPQPAIRVIAIIKRKHKMTTCVVYGANNQIHRVPGKQSLIKENWNLQYSAGFIMCELPRPPFKGPPEYVSFDISNANKTEKRVKIESLATEKKGNLSICVKAFHYHFDRAVWLVEFIEMHRILGADHFFFYNHTVGPNVEAVLRHYIDKGVVSLLQWTLPVKSQKEIRTEGIFAALNDCNLRSVGRYSLATNIDIDEFLIPRYHKTLVDLIGAYPNHSHYSFQNVFFYLYWNNDTEIHNKLFSNSSANLGEELFGQESYMPYLLTAYKTQRLQRPHRHGQRSKYIIRPERIVELGNHNIWQWIGGKNSKMFSPKEALSHHYRICEFGGYDCLRSPSEIDRAAHKWLIPLVKRVAKACSSIFTKTKACPVAPPLGSPW